ncbi:phthiocerol/phenolphthiocerol synthesis type-I polyketide synthase D [Thermoflexales bacterium]|nr:phthiocerol/phenolphthiocerol synthesis type-I polyketide synthase D [Thermoflexales bacterium]
MSVSNLPETNQPPTGLDIAIIGMAGRFPGSNNLDEFWQNLCKGAELISFFTEEELKASGVMPSEYKSPNYVPAAPVLSDIDLFDADFFGYSPLEAKAMDPQQRLLLECAWEALEHAGYVPEKHPEPIGSFVGARMSSYVVGLYADREFSQPQNMLLVLLGNDISSLSTRLSYKLNLTGPSYALQTGCSTSLVAVHVACQSLLAGECRLALAGGVTINVPHKVGYLYEPNSMLSPDGHCHTFDAKAEGTVFGSGMGMIVLKRLEDALADGDTIYAVVKGSATNNDGSFKASFTAPSVEGQSGVIIDALAMSGIDAETISYVEAHATATALGDPIEVRALTNAYRAMTKKKGYCCIGSVKSNLGHLDTAAGMAGLLKTTLALQHKQIPPTLHYEQPNPEIDFANSPFYVNTELVEWNTEQLPRRAGVSSFGFGGTNAHIILEEAPAPEPSGSSREWQLLLVSARTSSALDKVTQNLSAHLQQHPEINLADIAHTLQVGRHDFGRRRMVVCRTVAEAAQVLESGDPDRVFTNERETGERPVTFLFPGQGAQYVNMSLELYRTELAFREIVDRCADLLQPELGLDLRQVLYPTTAKTEEATAQLEQTAFTQPALFVVEYALAQLWMSWGIQPQSMMGHSIGEYVAACLAGVFSLEDALKLVVARGRMMQARPAGAMLSVPLPAAEVQAWLNAELALAASNAPTLSVVSGTSDAIEDLERQITELGLTCRRLHTSHAFHSAMMDPIVEPFAQLVGKIQLNPPVLPFVSNVTGTWITPEQATDPKYWAQHLRQAVRFTEGLQTLTQESAGVLLEVGPGRTLSTFARQSSKSGTPAIVINTLRHPQDEQSDVAFLLTALGKLWLSGLKIDWTAFYAGERRHRIALPTYPFERQRYWAQADASALGFAQQRLALEKKPDISDWFYLPSWKYSMQPEPVKAGELAATPGNWLIFADSYGLGDQLIQRLHQEKQTAIKVLTGEKFGKIADRVYTIHPQHPQDYLALLAELHNSDQFPGKLVHLWTVTPDDQLAPENGRLDQMQSLGFYSLLWLAQALGAEETPTRLDIGVISNQLHDLIGLEQLSPEKATVLGPCRVISQEYPQLTCRSVDVVIPQLDANSAAKMADQILAEMGVTSPDCIIAYRNARRWVQSFEPIHLKEPNGQVPRLRQHGVYLITGGLGGVGLVLAKHLAKTRQAKLILVGRSPFPPRQEWSLWQKTRAESDAISRKIQQLQNLEALGSEVLILSADVTNREQMQAVVAQSTKHFGVLHGVIHAAGIGSGGIMQLKTADTIEPVFAPKTQGVLALDVACRDVPLDFMVYCSSLTSVVGEFGQADYAAANAFMDAFAQRRATRQGTYTVSINWDTWQQVGMAVNMEVPPEMRLIHEQTLHSGLEPDEGVQIFERVLAQSTAPQMLISTRDLTARIESLHLMTRSLMAEAQEQARTLANRTGYARPELATAYIAPRNEFEQNVAAVWQQILGIEQVGIHDSFFDLGGHSLLITQMMNKLHRLYPVELSMRGLFDKPTVAGMAQVIEEAYTKKARAPEKPIKELLREAPPSERPGLADNHWKKRMAGLLKIEESQLPVDGSLAAYDLQAMIGDVQWVFEKDFGLQVYPHETVQLHSTSEFAHFTISEIDRLSKLKHNTVTLPTTFYQEYEERSQLEERVKRPLLVKPTRKNSPIVFSHSCVRSGSTLFRVMLAGHPALYAPPELGILWYDTLRDWHRSMTDPNYGHGFYWAAQGLQWSFMELLGRDPDGTHAYLDEMVERDVPIYEVYAQLQELAAPRLLVDKSPSYTMSLETLHRAEEFFEGPKYIHLIRHPYAVIESVTRIRLDKLFSPVIYGTTEVDSHVVAEKVWVTSNRNTLAFLQHVPPERQLCVRYEELVSRPEEIMRGVCDFMEIPYDPAVIEPYDNKRERMISGMGDPNILKHDKVDAQLGESWRKIHLPWQLGAQARQLAHELQYELPNETETPYLTILDKDLLLTTDTTKMAGLMENVAQMSDEEVKLLLEKLEQEEQQG